MYQTRYPNSSQTKSVLSKDKAADPLQFGLSLMEITSALNLYQKGTSQTVDVTPLEYLARGEKGWDDLSFYMGDGSFPMVFDVDTDFHNYVSKMEERVREKEGNYDPFDKNFPPPLPINERLLPGLCLGKGGLKCTHDKRECIQHRLICVLLNKLAHNYYKLSQKLEDCFIAVCGGKKCVFPEQLLQALIHRTC